MLPPRFVRPVARHMLVQLRLARHLMRDAVLPRRVSPACTCNPAELADEREGFFPPAFFPPAFFFPHALVIRVFVACMQVLESWVLPRSALRMRAGLARALMQAACQ